MIVLLRFILTSHVAFDILLNQRVTMVLVIACRVIAFDFFTLYVRSRKKFSAKIILLK